MTRLLVVAVVSLAAAGAEAQPRCEVPGVGAAVAVTVTPPGSPAFPLEVSDGFVVRPRAGDHEVEVSAPLGFTATAADVPMQLTREVQSGYGMVRVGPGTSVHRVRAAAGGRVRLSASAGRWVTVHGLEVECGDVELGPRPTGGSYSCMGGPNVWSPKAGHLVLRTRPGGGASIRVAVHEPSLVCFEQTARDGDWLRLRWTNPAMTLEGWARRDRLRAVIGMAGGGGYSSCSFSGRCSMGHGTGPGLYQGPALLRAGARVFAAAGRGEWARASGDIEVEIRRRDGEAWAQLTRVPGLAETCDLLDHAWVAAGDVAISPAGGAGGGAASCPHCRAPPPSGTPATGSPSP